MTLATINPTEEFLSTDREVDLSSLACDAAIELDNLVIGKSAKIDAVQQLSELISETLVCPEAEATQASLLHPATVSVMRKAISDTVTLAQPLTTLDRLIEEASKINEQFSRLQSNPQQFKDQSLKELEEIRSFCLALSIRSAAYERPFDQWEPSTPFGR